MEKASATYRVLLDQRNVVGKAYNLKFVPVAIIVDERGRLVRGVGFANIYEGNFRRELTDWVTRGAIPGAWIDAKQPEVPLSLTSDEAEAVARFQLAVVLLEQGKKNEAIAELKRAIRLDPENWVIRKQLWALEVPEAFYSGDVDYDWQEKRMKKEDADMKKERRRFKK